MEASELERICRDVIETIPDIFGAGFKFPLSKREINELYLFDLKPQEIRNSVSKVFDFGKNDHNDI